MRFATSAILIFGVMVSGSTLAQSKPAAGGFDGKYVGQSIRCFPSGRILPRISFYSVKGNRFSHTFTLDGQARGCALTVGTDGSFNNKECAAPTSGRISGDRMDIEFRVAEAICNAVLKRE